MQHRKAITDPEPIRFPMHRKADITPDLQYRYSLTRIWDFHKPAIMFIGLNPSTADAVEDDPTIRRCVGFAKYWGYGTLYMTNLFAYRSTDPVALLDIMDPVGPRNMEAIRSFGRRARMVLFAWGTHTMAKEQALIIQQEFPKALCLQQTKDGSPQHPLYLKSDTEPQLFIPKKKK